MRRMKYIALVSLGLALAAGCTAPADKSTAAGLGPRFQGPLGLQLYSLRDSFKTNVPGTLAQVRALGFTHVELAGTYGQPPEQFAALLAGHNLKPIAAHFPFERYQTDLEGIAREARALGIQYAGCAWIPHQAPFDEKQCRAAAAVFNAAGAALAKHGLKFFYHNHGYEFAPHGQGTLMDLLMTETNPQHVAFEMDLLWTIFPGQDPAQWLAKYGPRWELVHLKDLKKGVVGNLSGGTDVRNDVALGTGQVDFPAVLQAAQKAGVKWYFIEDESPTVLDQLPQSLRFLEQVRW